MREKAKPYHIADIAYNPSYADMPWQIQRVGVVAEQGGLAFGYETLNFSTIEDATNYLAQTIKADISEYDRLIKQKETSNASVAD
jgi:hypothetical protein